MREEEREKTKNAKLKNDRKNFFLKNKKFFLTNKKPFAILRIAKGQNKQLKNGGLENEGLQRS